MPPPTHTPLPLLSAVALLALALSLASSPPPSLSIPFPLSPLPPASTPFSQSKSLTLGLENGRIRACPSVNPGCVSTNPQSPSSAFPWVIPEDQRDGAVESPRDAVLRTQRNVKIQTLEATPDGQYLQAEVDGGFGSDVMEFLVKRDIVAFRSMATKVTYVYPFTTAFGDSTGQKDRINKILEELGWFAPKLESMD